MLQSETIRNNFGDLLENNRLKLTKLLLWNQSQAVLCNVKLSNLLLRKFSSAPRKFGHIDAPRYVKSLQIVLQEPLLLYVLRQSSDDGLRIWPKIQHFSFINVAIHLITVHLAILLICNKNVIVMVEIYPREQLVS